VTNPDYIGYSVVRTRTQYSWHHQTGTRIITNLQIAKPYS